MAERRALAEACERLAWAGVSPGAIRETLDVSYKAYSRWAKIYGFRQGDIYPERARAGGWVGSARYTS